MAQLRANPRVRVLQRTTAFGYFPHNLMGLSERLTDHLAAPPPGLARERLWQVRAREVILATGAIEQPLVFPVRAEHRERFGPELGDDDSSLEGPFA